ncbi:bacteriocin-like protein [Mucilaginibacter sp. OK098]|uniref:bacteriocin-like protein n=1 Tax=Mucilaginibacter sp. OK098 TaxID=1855297 RepID=UPI0039777716
MKKLTRNEMKNVNGGKLQLPPGCTCGPLPALLTYGCTYTPNEIQYCQTAQYLICCNDA